MIVVGVSCVSESLIVIVVQYWTACLHDPEVSMRVFIITGYFETFTSKLYLEFLKNLLRLMQCERGKTLFSLMS